MSERPRRADWPADCGVVRSQLTNAQGLRLPVFTFRANPSKATAILCHGVGVSARHEFLLAPARGEVHTVFQGSIFDEFVKQGVSCVTYDHQGMGEAEGVRSGVRYFFNQFDDLARDLLQVHDTVRAEIGEDQPIFWCGISMGGGVCVRAAQMRKTSGPAGLVLMAPMISLTAVREEFIVPSLGIRNRHLYPVVNQLSAWFPAVKVVKKAENTVHPHLETEMLADPLNNSKPICIRLATEFVLVTEAFMAKGGEKSLEEVSCPDLLIVHALADKFVEPGGSVAAFQRCPAKHSKTLLLIGGTEPGGKNSGSLQSQGIPDGSRSLACLQKLKSAGMWHALTQEPGNTELVAAIATWICDCEGAKAARSPALCLRPHKTEASNLEPADRVGKRGSTNPIQLRARL